MSDDVGRLIERLRKKAAELQHNPKRMGTGALCHAAANALAQTTDDRHGPQPPVEGEK